jgi:uroporphyrinogen decarboxylase
MNYDIDMRKFWEVNAKCKTLKDDIPRVPVHIHLHVGDWICDFLKIDSAKYYSDYRYQQENRLKCSKITEKELDYRIYPDVDFGVIMDASIYGGKVNYESNATPTLQPVITDPAEIDILVERMNRVDLMEQGLVPEYFEWREKIRTEYGITLTYGGGIKGCCTMLGQICSITNFLTWIVIDPQQIHKLVDCWLNTSKRYIQMMRQHTNFASDQRALSFASDLSGMLSPELYREFIMDAEKELYDMFAPNPGDRRYYHADYHMLHHLDTFREMGVNAVNIDPYVTAGQILAKLPQAVVYGQIPPLKVLLYGTPEEVVACAKRDIEQAGPGKHLVLTTAGSINPGTSFENIKAMCYAAEKYGYIYEGSGSL